MADFGSVDEYIASFPEDVQAILQQVRETILAVVPESGSGEKISYQMPTVTLDDQSLIHFSGWKNNLAIYPVPPADEALTSELEPYRSGEGTLKFPLKKPIPYDLIRRITEAFVESRAK